uniref:Uncharacterized protein n=1 Tax=Meloidogyne incognita TaxID=6306 RepID=A0A914LFB6_MELIC
MAFIRLRPWFVSQAKAIHPKAIANDNLPIAAYVREYHKEMSPVRVYSYKPKIE